jgi:hypothetical protein
MWEWCAMRYTHAQRVQTCRPHFRHMTSSIGTDTTRNVLAVRHHHPVPDPSHAPIATDTSIKINTMKANHMSFMVSLIWRIRRLFRLLLCPKILWAITHLTTSTLASTMQQENMSAHRSAQPPLCSNLGDDHPRRKDGYQKSNAG